MVRNKMIPVAKPFLGSQEIDAVAKTIQSGWVTQGPKVLEFENQFAAKVNSPFACAVSNCTTALHLSLLAVGVKPGDVVITVSHSFIATANAIRHCSAEAVFVDIDIDTFNISVEKLKECLARHCARRGRNLIYKHTDKIVSKASPLFYIPRKKRGKVAAILVVHQMGLPADMKNILSLAKKYRLPVVEDAACAIGSEISLTAGKSWEKIGAPLADAAVFSFHPRKIITTGDGGMITTKQKNYDARFRRLRHHGMNISDLKRHQAKSVIQEEYVETAYNYRLTDIQASVGIEQLKRLDEIIRRRRELARYYLENLKSVSWLALPPEPVYAKTNWQSFCVRVLKNAPLRRDKIMQKLLDQGISTRAGIMNAHQQKPYRNAHWKLPASEQANQQGIILPLYHTMTIADCELVVSALRNI
jgi:dTDP-4-amino-4,6-dideoxygalactose transaminase